MRKAVNVVSEKLIHGDGGDVDRERFALKLGQVMKRLVGLGCAHGLIPPVFDCRRSGMLETKSSVNSDENYQLLL